MKPMLTTAQPTLIETLPPLCLPLASLLTSEAQLRAACERPPNNGGGGGQRSASTTFYDDTRTVDTPLDARSPTD